MRAKQMIRSVLILNPNIWAFGLDTRRQVNRLLRRPFDHDFTFLKWFHPPDGTEFVDAGANIGEAIEAMRLYHPHIPITAFEPCAATFAKLNNSVGNLENITLIQCALSDVSGSLQLYIPACNGAPISSLASNFREDATEWIEQFAGEFAKDTNIEVMEETVHVMTVDQMNLTPSFLKIDVQGSETQVLQGSMDTLKRCSPVIMIEQSPNDRIGDLLEPLGYRPYRYEGGRLLKGANKIRNAFYLTEGHRGMIGPMLE